MADPLEAPAAVVVGVGHCRGSRSRQGGDVPPVGVPWSDDIALIGRRISASVCVQPVVERRVTGAESEQQACGGRSAMR